MADQQIGEGRRTPIHYYLLLAFIAIIVTAANLQYSMRCGRLAIPPSFDDVGYMADSARCLDVFWRQGVIGELRLYRQNPPHSPWSLVLGMIGFGIFGIRDWAVYAMNFTVVLGYLLFADYLLGRAKLWQKLVCFAFLLAMPIIPESVAEFRPDHACSLFTVIACMLLLEQSVTRASARRLAVTGAMFGLAMFAKPSTFPAVIILMLACLVMSTAADWWGDETPINADSVGRAWGIVIGASAAVALLYFSVGLGQILTYIKDNMFGQYQSVWKYKGDFHSAILYDLTGEGGKAMLGQDLWLLLALLGIGGLYCNLTGTRSEKARMTVLGFLLLGTFMMAIMNHMKSIFTGLTFQTCLVLMAVRSLAYLLTKSPGNPWKCCVAVFAMVLAVHNFQWPQSWGDYNGQLATSRRQMANGIYGTLVQHMRRDQNRVLIQGIGDINSALFTYMAIKDQRNMVFYAPPDTDKIAPAIAEWDRFDFIVASQKDTQITANFNLRHASLDELLALLRQRPEWQEIGFYPFVFSGKGYYIFQRVPR